MPLMTRLRDAILRLPGFRGLAWHNQAYRHALRTLGDQMSTMEPAIRSLVRTNGILLENACQATEAALESRQQLSLLAKRIDGIAEQIDDLERRRVVRTRNFRPLNPEVALFQYLGAFLPSRNAVDVGAHVGDITVPLLGSGFQVDAFEPNPSAFAQLEQRLSAHARVRLHREALGAIDGSAELHLASDRSGTNSYPVPTLYSSLATHAMPEGLAFTDKVLVPVRRLESLATAGEIPSDLGLLKIDAEGRDLDVLSGLGELRPTVVSSEFWDNAFVFGRDGAGNALPDTVTEMRRRGYEWHIVLYRLEDDDSVAYYCCLDEAIERSWGNVVFFKSRDTFEHARNWCSATLPETFFRS